MVLLKIKYFKLLVFEYFFACSGSSIHFFSVLSESRFWTPPPIRNPYCPDLSKARFYVHNTSLGCAKNG